MVPCGRVEHWCTSADTCACVLQLHVALCWMYNVHVCMGVARACRVCAGGQRAVTAHHVTSPARLTLLHVSICWSLSVSEGLTLFPASGSLGPGLGEDAAYVNLDVGSLGLRWWSARVSLVPAAGWGIGQRWSPPSCSTTLSHSRLAVGREVPISRSCCLKSAELMSTPLKQTSVFFSDTWVIKMSMLL